MMKSKLKDYALRLLSSRDRSVQELKERLLKHYDPIEVEELLGEFIRLGYLDDRRFTQNWIESRNRFRPTGNFGLRYELSKKGVSDDIIEEFLNDPDLEYQLAFRLAKAKSEQYARLPEKKRYQRIGAHLQRQGFSWDTTYRVLREVLSYLLDTDP